MKKKTIKATVYCFYDEEPPLDCHFVAIYSDISGADIFRRDKDGNFQHVDDKKLVPPDAYWFADSGYLYFIVLPKWVRKLIWG